MFIRIIQTNNNIIMILVFSSFDLNKFKGLPSDIEIKVTEDPDDSEYPQEKKDGLLKIYQSNIKVFGENRQKIADMLVALGAKIEYTEKDLYSIQTFEVDIVKEIKEEISMKKNKPGSFVEDGKRYIIKKNITKEKKCRYIYSNDRLILSM